MRISVLACVLFYFACELAMAQAPQQYDLKISPRDLPILGIALGAAQREAAELAQRLQVQIDAQNKTEKPDAGNTQPDRAPDLSK